jgi:hypothetical protein
MMADTQGQNGAQTPNNLHVKFSLSCALWQQVLPPIICSLLKVYDGGPLTPASQQALLAEWRRPLAKLLPPSADYQRRVLRAVILEAEQQGQEVCEELMQVYSDCLIGRPSSNDGSSLMTPPPQPGWCYKLYAYAPTAAPLASVIESLAALESQALKECARSQQQQQQPQQQGQQAAVTCGDGLRGLLALHASLNLLEGGTGCHEWEAGFFLAEWVLSHPQLVAGERAALQLCGNGLTNTSQR